MSHKDHFYIIYSTLNIPTKLINGYPIIISLTNEEDQYQGY
eukprot:CAMPEP_0170763606 /NCGR_PEP_ID=MMETSP0733-20121128/3496_1 /TAXON_ID=186038 /ORGANISM="Fragilariopsis kerguelensis, Strain L26-C5" /LENGTH=40 /DNA_ID= /DNA_START= /DNA_END= /DNA_ORIENTATION=